MVAIQLADLRTRPIPNAPDTFYGLRSDYIAQWLDPVLCDVDEVDRLHLLLARYAQSQSPTLLVRYVTGMKRGEIYQTRAGARLKATDNAPAWWWHSLLFNRLRLDWENLSSFIEAAPWHFHQMGKWTTINHSGWHAAHIFDVKDGDTDWRAWSRESAVRRFIRNVSPLNVFFVPKTEWRRVGADRHLIAAVAAHYRRRHASVWMDFLRLAQGQPELAYGAVDGPLIIGHRDGTFVGDRDAHRRSRSSPSHRAELWRRVDAQDSRIVTLNGNALGTNAPKTLAALRMISTSLKNRVEITVGELLAENPTLARSYVQYLAAGTSKWSSVIALDGMTSDQVPVRSAPINSDEGLGVSGITDRVP
jgi:hypothetical protein